MKIVFPDFREQVAELIPQRLQRLNDDSITIESDIDCRTFVHTGVLRNYLSRGKLEIARVGWWP